MKNVLIITVIIFFLFPAIPAHAWPLYSKPEFRGRAVDAETKQPIEGAVVVVLYYKRSTFDLNPGGTSSYVFSAKETLTDNKGEFYFPSYSSLILFSEDAGTKFIFFKPGYMYDIGPNGMAFRLIEKYFSSDVVGKDTEIETGSYDDGSYVKWKGPQGIMELKKAKTREEKLRSIPSPPTDYTSKELPIFIRIINEECKNLGLKGEYK